jgi:DNA-binding response OmpR family regulator
MKKILIIEDDLDILEITQIILEQEGYEIYAISDCNDIYHQLTEILPDLILLDINLPGFDGRDICEYIKSYNRLKHIPVVMMSANLDIEEIAKRCGADGIIKKPFDMVELAGTVAHYLNSEA